VERTEGFVTLGDGVRIFFVEKGSGPDVLVAPAALYLEPLLLDRLSAKRRVIFYDPRNRGRSDSADLSHVSLDRQIADLEELRAELGLEEMILLGWSSYGLEMAVYAMRYPERVTRLVQISPLAPAASIMERFSNSRSYQPHRFAIEALDQRANDGEFDETPEEYCRLRSALTIPADFVNAELARQVPDDCQYPNEWPTNRSPYFRAFFGTLGEFDWRQELKNLGIPRLIIHGREDRIPLEGAEAWAEGYKDARLITLSPSGHFPFIEQEEAVLEAVETFLGGDWPKNARAIQSDND
jgi:proline iminopeptidase